MDLIITILPVVTKDLPISPRFTPYDFFITRQVQHSYNSSTNGFRYGRKNTNPALTRIELTTSALAGVQITY